ncbi:hypothetical protein [Sunxiuqinia elliptica]|uniref:Curlin associated repeat protein n=1 Tax=Sunxiuqinia elliptica TaxID=655355 RepID=A0A4R6H9W4_9BACT|nr:hypothetical protein [Sunxiuqinia elliptica]TDO05142.1 curlin associated repeat protein [Sunxiuqinia elliptica]TDO64691.1 curlin associated repeat protein [Sunxiuqinia elliptica]
MKRFSLFFALVFAVSMTMAQHVSTVMEDGDGNTANITQGFDGSGTSLDGNMSYVDQLGDDNDAMVTQYNNGYGGQAHNSEIFQTGDENTASVEQQNATGDAYINQVGDDNEANILEVGNFGTPAPAAGIAPYDAYASQEGDGNTVNMSIFGDGASAVAIQKGDYNIIYQELGQDVGNKVFKSSAYANQMGDSNEAIQIMEGQGFAGAIEIQFERERIWQTGDNNYAHQLQTDDLLPGGINYAEVKQTGDWNESWQTQSGMNNDSRVTQNGDSNWSVTTQFGNDNVVVVQQN